MDNNHKINNELHELKDSTVKSIFFDVLIVYNSDTASSASKPARIRSPFPTKTHDTYNKAYSYFLEKLHDKNVEAAFSTVDDLLQEGHVKSYWTYENRKWIKNIKRAYARFIFNKTSSMYIKPSKQWVNFAKGPIIFFTNPEVIKLFLDKYETYKRLSDFSLPTILVGKLNKHNLISALSQLSEISNFDDFVLKDRYGAGGNNVLKFKRIEKYEEIFNTCKKEAEEDLGKLSFILQPFVDAAPIIDRDISNPSDIRVIYIDNQPIQSFVRVAKRGDFRSNTHQGGLLFALPVKKVPEDINLFAEKILKRLGFTDALFSLDFMKGKNGKIYLIEGNSSPGITWIKENKDEKTAALELIDQIVANIEKRLKNNGNAKNSLTGKLTISV
ncbi:MAG TPA: sugar-transfer associated ATP-grasp domain-containing protein [Patescibacteria group bacterium]|nr:sugar-transfer associated ATP-grasp domain-containing protein [Patescibacteria group bacterium]